MIPASEEWRVCNYRCYSSRHLQLLRSRRNHDRCHSIQVTITQGARVCSLFCAHQIYHCWNVPSLARYNTLTCIDRLHCITGIANKPACGHSLLQHVEARGSDEEIGAQSFVFADNSRGEDAMTKWLCKLIVLLATY